jgi:hypothetical protein
MNTLSATETVGSNGTHAGGFSPSQNYLSPFTDDRSFREQIERILQSEELRGSDVLRRLLTFLAEKTISGEADELKEYTVAIDGLGKPPSYDPRHTSAVRIQAGRLRQKLIDYYRAEGSNDALVVTLPKGHFRLTSRQRLRAVDAEQPLSHPGPMHAAPRIPEDAAHREKNSHEKRSKWMRYGPFLWIALISIGLNIYLWARHPWGAKAADATAAAELSPGIKDLWGTFIDSKRPLMLVLEDPLFVEFKTGPGVYYRDKSLNSWNDVPSSPAVVKLRAALNNPSMQPSNYYTAFGEAHAAFLIGRLFGARNQNYFSLVRATQVSPAQMAANNIVSVGIPSTMFNNQLQEMPIQSQFSFELDGIRNLHPRQGEQTLYADQFKTAPDEEGVTYALVSHFPGPLRNTDVESFVGNRSAGYVAAVQAFVDPDFAREVATRLKQESGGKLPRYFQVLLRVSFHNSVPTDTTCVLVRELR